MDTPERKPKAPFSLENMEGFLKGGFYLPNFVEMEPAAVVGIVAASPFLRFVRGEALILGERDLTSFYSAYFLTGIYDRFDGGGYVMFYDFGKGRTGRFAICAHEIRLARDANPTRGWLPGHCKFCGFDMTTDSGD